VLKDHPRPLIEVLRDDARLDAGLVSELNALLPERWLAERLETNRRTRLMGEAA
jgi:hypothetical protein